MIEVMIAVSLLTGIVIIGGSTSTTISSASSYGRHKLQIQSENQGALYYIANDLQNSSSDSDPVTNEPRFEVLDDDPVVELKTRTARSLADGDKADTRSGIYESVSKTTTSVEGTKTRTVSVDGDSVLDDAVLGDPNVTPDKDGEVIESRPRLMRVAANTRFNFRKVIGYEVDAAIGEVSPIWSSPVSYYVRGRRLIREQDGQRRVIGQNVSAFKVFAKAKGTFLVFLRTQKRSPTTGEVLTASGTIEVNPKNR